MLFAETAPFLSIFCSNFIRLERTRGNEIEVFHLVNTTKQVAFNSRCSTYFLLPRRSFPNSVNWISFITFILKPQIDGNYSLLFVIEQCSSSDRPRLTSVTKNRQTSSLFLSHVSKTIAPRKLVVVGAFMSCVKFEKITISSNFFALP